ncbi:Purine permease 21 [Linum perenne]
MWWMKVTLYTMLVLLGQSVALLLGRLYFLEGGNSKWMSSFVQVAGFPILIPYYIFTTIKQHKQLLKDHQEDDDEDEFETSTKAGAASRITLISIYTVLGLIIGFICFLYSVGLQYLPVSTYTLVCASQLAFNSFFSYFINSQKFTPFVVNALVLLTISSILLVFNNDDPSSSSSSSSSLSRLNFIIGFICTLSGSALYGLVLSVAQYVFTKVIKRKTTFKDMMDMIIYENLVATVLTLVGLFGSGEWKVISREMDSFHLGAVSYLMTLISIAVFWQLFSIGIVGLIFQVSSLFSNSISVVGLPIVPIMAVFCFHDTMNGIKGVSMVLALWGFVSFIYQYYLDDQQTKRVDDHQHHPASSSPLN